MLWVIGEHCKINRKLFGLSLKFEQIIEGMKCYTIEDIEEALNSAGFTKVKADHHKSKPWITVLAKK